MDILRYVLALGVFVAHYNFLLGHTVPFMVSSYESVGGFFALSGFLMYSSYVKKGSVMRYVKSRARKIMPPYLFIVLLCAIALSLVSTLDLKAYCASAQLYKYLLANVCFLNWIQPTLPGVFDDIEISKAAVNGSLWTMKVEWCLYLSVPIFVWVCGKVRRKEKLVALIIVVVSIAYRCLFMYLFEQTGKPIYEILGRQFFGQLSYFYCGMLVYFYIDVFKKYIWQIGAIGIVIGMLSYNIGYYGIIIQPIAFTSVLMALSLCSRDAKILRHKRNLSYNIYLFHYPVIQLYKCLGIDNSPVYVSFTVIFMSVLILAYVAERYISFSK